MGCPRQKMPQLLYIAASLLQNRFENILKMFRVHGCWILYHGFTRKICGKFLKMKKSGCCSLLQQMGTRIKNLQQMLQIRELWSDMHKSLHGGAIECDKFVPGNSSVKKWFSKKSKIMLQFQNVCSKCAAENRFRTKHIQELICHMQSPLHANFYANLPINL